MTFGAFTLQCFLEQGECRDLPPL